MKNLKIYLFLVLLIAGLGFFWFLRNQKTVLEPQTSIDSQVDPEQLFKTLKEHERTTKYEPAASSDVGGLTAQVSGPSKTPPGAQPPCIKKLDGKSFSSSFKICPGTYNLTTGFEIVGPAVVDGSNAVIVGPHTGFPPVVVGVKVSSDYVTVKNLNFQNWTIGLMVVKKSTIPCCDNIKIENNFFNNVQTGITAYDLTNSIITNNRVSSEFGFQVFRITNPKTSLGTQIINNVLGSVNITGRYYNTGIDFRDSFNHSVKNVVAGNVLRYKNCKSSGGACGGSAMFINGPYFLINNNEIYDYGGVGPVIFTAVSSSVISNNKITGLWKGRSPVTTGIYLPNGYGYKTSDLDNLISNNTISSDGSSGTRGYSNYDTVTYSGTGGTMITGNTFKDLELGLGIVPAKITSVADELRKNNFIGNGTQIDEIVNSDLPIIASRNFFDDHDCIDSDGNDYCENAYSWSGGFNQDPQPKATKY